MPTIRHLFVLIGAAVLCTACLPAMPEPPVPPGLDEYVVDQPQAPCDNCTPGLSPEKQELTAPAPQAPPDGVTPVEIIVDFGAPLPNITPPNILSIRLDDKPGAALQCADMGGTWTAPICHDVDY